MTLDDQQLPPPAVSLPLIYQTAFALMDQGFCLIEKVNTDTQQPPDFRYRLVNPAFEKHTGLSGVVGKTIREVVSEPQQSIMAIYEQVAASGQSSQFEAYVAPLDLWMEANVFRISPQPTQLAVLFTNITQRKQAEEALRRSAQRDAFLVKLTDTLRPLAYPIAIQQAALSLIGHYLNLDRALYNEIDPDITAYTTLTNYAREGFPAYVGRFAMGPFTETVKSLQRGKTLVIDDVAKEERFSQAERDYCISINVRSFVTVPLIKDGHWVVNLVVHDSKARPWTPDEVSILEETAERTWAAVERAKAEVALRASEDKYRTLYQSIDEGFTLIELIVNEGGQVVDFIYQETNPAFVNQVGLALQGKRRSELYLDQQDFVLDQYDHLFRTGEPLHFEHHVPNLGGQWFEVTATRMGGEGSKLLGVVFRNVTQRKRQEQQQAFLLTLSDRLRTLEETRAIQRIATQLVGELLQVDCALYNEVAENGDIIFIADSYVRGNFPKVTGHYGVGQFGAAMEVLRRGELLIIENQTTTSLKSPSERAVSTGLGVMASATVPLIKQGRWVANFGVLQGSPRQWREDELALLKETAERTWAAVERAKAEEALRESQRRFESIANLVPDLLWESQPDGATNWYNQRWLDYTGQRFEEAIGWCWVEAIHPDERAGSTRQYDQAVAAGTSLRQEHRIRRHDGAYRWFVVSASPLKDQRGQVVKMYGAATDIHESKQAQEALQRREAELARVQQIGLISGVAIDVANQLTGKRSPEYLQLHGLSADTQSETHQDWLRRLHPDDRGPAEQTLLSALQGNQSSYESEYRIIRPNDGRLVWIYAKMDIERNAGGGPIRLVGVHIDITRRKQAEEALGRLEQRNRLAIEAAQLATWEWDLIRDQVYWNEQHFRLFGMRIEPNPLPAMAFMNHLHPDDADAIKEQLHQTIAERSLYDAEFRIVRDDGQVRWMNGYGRVTVEQDGQPRQMSGVMLDITQRKHQEQVLASELASTTLLSELGARLVTEENRHSLSEAILSAAIAITHADGGTLQLYDPASRELVLLVTRHFERRMTDYFHRVGADSQTVCGIALKTGQRTFVDYDDNQPDIACRMHVEAGYLSAQSTPLVSRKGMPIGMLNTHWRQARHRPSASELRFLDLLARQTADFLEQRQTEEALRLADQRKDEFLAMLAHELRNPLAPIRNGLQLLAQTHTQDQLLATMLPILNRQMDHVMRLVDDLLDVSRISRGKIELHKQPIDLTQVVAQTLQAMQPLYTASGKQLTAQLPDHPLYLDGDGTRLTQVVANLLSNGLRYTHEGGQVWLGLERLGEQAVLRVSDNGIGLAADQLEAIFDLFVQVDTSLARSNGGLGLGLALVQQLVQLHGGRVEAHSPGLGHGSAFVVYLPILIA